MIDEIIKQKQCVCKKSFNNSSSSRRELRKIINIILILASSIKTTINQIFSDVFFRIININQMFILIINIRTTTKVAIILIIKMNIKTLIITFKINIINTIKR